MLGDLPLQIPGAFDISKVCFHEMNKHSLVCLHNCAERSYTCASNVQTEGPGWQFENAFQVLATTKFSALSHYVAFKDFGLLFALPNCARIVGFRYMSVTYIDLPLHLLNLLSL